MKNVVVVIPRNGNKSADLYQQAQDEIGFNPYDHIELDGFKTIYRRKEILKSLKEGWSLIETTDLASILILRVMRLHDEIDNLTIISNEGVDPISTYGRHEGTISECEELLDWALDELIKGKQ